MIAEADIQNMTTAEKLAAINLIWESLEEDIPSPAWHGEILEKRVADLEAGRTNLITMEELTLRLDALRDERANRRC
jgi:hypothetical protein